MTFPTFRQDRLAHWRPNYLIPRSRDPLVEIPRSEWRIAAAAQPEEVTGVWRSHAWFVQRREENGMVLLQVMRTKCGADGRWLGGISWDDLQWIKAQCGYADACAVEVFPPEAYVVNGTNIRHLHVLPELPPYCWTEVTA